MSNKKLLDLLILSLMKKGKKEVAESLVFELLILGMQIYGYLISFILENIGSSNDKFTIFFPYNNHRIRPADGHNLPESLAISIDLCYTQNNFNSA